MTRWLLALLALGCASTSASVRPESPATFVLVRDDAELFRGPSADAVPMQLFRRAKPASGAPLPLRYVGEANGLVEVETVPGDAQCAWVPTPLAQVRLRLFVRPEALLDVTTRRVSASYSDGTAVTLEPGVAVEEKTPAGYRFTLDELPFAAPLPDDAVGKRFEQPRPNPEQTGEPAGSIDKDSGAVLNGVALSLPDLAFPLEKLERRADGAFVTLRLSCGELVLRAAAPTDQGPGGLLGALVDSGGEAMVFEPGTAVFWPDGTPAGTVVARVGVPGPRVTVDDLTCVRPEPLDFFAPQPAEVSVDLARDVILCRR